MGKEVSRKEAAVCEADQYSPQGESGTRVAPGRGSSGDLSSAR